jgi:hypothetical protein
MKIRGIPKSESHQNICPLQILTAVTNQSHNPIQQKQKQLTGQEKI